MRRVTKALSAFISACVLGAGVAWICGCEKVHTHHWSENYKAIDGTDIHAKTCIGCSDYIEGHTAEWSDENDDACDHEGCTVKRLIPSENIITVTSTADSVAKGKTLQLTASETGVTWAVSEGIVGIFISESGLLTVAADASATSVVVTASKTGFTAGTKTITVTEAALPVSDEINNYEAGVYADGLFNLLEIKSATTVSVNGADYTVGKITDGRATLTAGSGAGTITKIRKDDGYVYAVEIRGKVSTTFSPFSDFGLDYSDFVGIYVASNGIIENDGGTYYKYGRFAFLEDGTAIVTRVEVVGESGAEKQGAREVSFLVRGSGTAVSHNILDIDDDWRVVGLGENADEVAVIRYTQGRESAVRGDYAKSEDGVPALVGRLPIAAGERYAGEKLTISCETDGSYCLGTAPLYGISGNSADGYLVSSSIGGVPVNYVLKFQTVEGAKQIKAYETDGVTLVDTLILQGEASLNREYEEMTGGSVTLNFSSESRRYLKAVAPSAGKYVVSAETADFLEGKGATLTIDGTEYGYAYDGVNWTVAEGGLVFVGDLRAGAEVKIEVACPSAELGAVTVRIETKADYDRRKAQENAPPVFGEERLGTYYGGCGGIVNKIVIGEAGVTYNQTALTFISKRGDKFSYRGDNGNLIFSFGQDGALSVADGISGGDYTANKEVEWQGFTEDRCGSYSFYGEVGASDAPVNLSISITVDGKSVKYRLTQSDGDEGEAAPMILIGYEQGVYTFMDAHGAKVTFRFNGENIEVLSDGIQQLVAIYTAVKDEEAAATPARLSIGADNIIAAGGAYLLASERAMTVVLTFDESRLTVNTATEVVHSGDAVTLKAGEGVTLTLSLTDGAEGTTLHIVESINDEENVNNISAYEELALGNNVVDFCGVEAASVYLSVGAGTYRLSFTNVKSVTVGDAELSVDGAFTAQTTVELTDFMEIIITLNDGEQPVKVKVKKIN